MHTFRWDAAVNKREFYRLTVDVPFRVEKTSEPGNKAVCSLSSRTLPGTPRTICLSGSGVRFRAGKNHDYEQGDDVIVDFLIGDTVICATGKVVRIQGENIGVKFDVISERSRDAISRFIFEKERELIAKRKTIVGHIR